MLIAAMLQNLLKLVATASFYSLFPISTINATHFLSKLSSNCDSVTRNSQTEVCRTMRLQQEMNARNMKTKIYLINK